MAVPILLPLLLGPASSFPCKPCGAHSPLPCCSTAPAAWTMFVCSQQRLHPRGAESPALVGSPARMLPMPAAAFSLPQQANAVSGSPGCFPRDAGCVASPAEGCCLCCLTTSWLCSAKSCVGMKKQDQTHQPGPLRRLGSQGELSPIPLCSLGCCGHLYEDSSSSLLRWDGGRWAIWSHLAGWRSWDAAATRGWQAEPFSLMLVNAQDMTPIFSFCL